MVGGLNSRTARMHKKASSRNIESSLPDELLFDILVRLPADDLYQRARLVCRRWSHIIRSDAFVNTHLHHSTYGLLFSAYGPRKRNPIYVSATKQERIEISELNYKSTTDWGSCNGLVLKLKENSLYILNRATRRAFLLPPFEFDSKMVFGSWGMAYNAASMEYKVVQSHIPECEPRVIHVAVLSVGVDNSWRHVQVEHLPHDVRGHFHHIPLITEGFVHWAGESEKVLTMNVETEVIKETNVPLPKAYLSASIRMYYLSTGRFLTLLVGRKDLIWEVWEMKPETGEWRKCTQHQFDCELHEDHELLWPQGWVKYPEVLACRTGCAATCTFYNLRTNEIDSCELPASLFLEYNVLPHRNTLVWLS